MDFTDCIDYMGCKMLNIYLGDMKEAVYHHPTYFDNMYEDEWITNPLSVEMIFDVDKSLRKESKVVQTKKQYGDFSLTALSFASISIFSG